MALETRTVDDRFPNTRRRPSRGTMAAGWLALLAVWLLLLAGSMAAGEVSGLVVGAVLATLGVVVAEVGYATGLLVLGALVGPVEIGVGAPGLRLRYESPTGWSERWVPWTTIHRVEWTSLRAGEVRVLLHSSAPGAQRLQVETRGTFPLALRRFLPPEALLEVDLEAPA